MSDNLTPAEQAWEDAKETIPEHDAEFERKHGKR